MLVHQGVSPKQSLSFSKLKMTMAVDLVGMSVLCFQRCACLHCYGGSLPCIVLRTAPLLLVRKNAATDSFLDAAALTVAEIAECHPYVKHPLDR